jgi:hypothetical protein
VHLLMSYFVTSPNALYMVRKFAEFGIKGFKLTNYVLGIHCTHICHNAQY